MKTLNKIIFYVLSWTWGCIMTVIGAIGALGLLITGHKPKRFHHMIYFEVGRSWGGVNFGMFFFTSKGCGLSTKQHETGHGFQNAVLGPLFPFLVGLPSATRCLLYDFPTRKSKTKYCVILYIIISVVSIGLAVLTLLTIPWTVVFPIFLFLYGTALCGWLLFVETPKFDKGYVNYYSVWFEGQASRLGEKYCPSEVL